MSETVKATLKPEPGDGQQPKIVPSPDDVIFYTNLAIMRVSAEEMVLQFGRINPDDPSQSPSVARAYMTPGHAKRLLILLNAVIGQYETTFGTITADPNSSATQEARKRREVPEK